MTDSEPGSDETTSTERESSADADGRIAENAGIRARYAETETERLLTFEATSESAADGTAAIAQNREGYAMVKVRPTADGDELERYYGFDMALDHVAELLGVRAHELPVPPAAEDMGM